MAPRLRQAHILLDQVGSIVTSVHQTFRQELLCWDVVRDKILGVPLLVLIVDCFGGMMANSAPCGALLEGVPAWLSSDVLASGDGNGRHGRARSA